MSRVALTLKTKLIVAIAALAIAGGAIVGFAQSNDSKPQQNQQATTTTQQALGYVKYQGEEGKTALDLLKQNAQVETKTSAGLGEYVVSINGNDGGGSKYWLYYVNGQPADVGAGSYTTKSTDTIEWKLQ